jgi:hypothetical protein
MACAQGHHEFDIIANPATARALPAGRPATSNLIQTAIRAAIHTAIGGDAGGQSNQKQESTCF